MKPLSVNKSIRTPFLLITTSFVAIGFLGLFFLVQIQKSIDEASLSLNQLEGFYRTTLSVGRISDELARKNKRIQSSAYLADFQKSSFEYHEYLHNLKNRNKNSYFNTNFFNDLLYDRNFDYLETFIHLGKVQKHMIQDLKRNGFVKNKNLFPQMRSYLIKTLDTSSPLLSKVRENRKGLEKIRYKILVGTCLSFFVLLLTVFYFVYIPWKKDYHYLERERSRLQGVIKESEIRGNTFSWEVNFETKLTKRSNFLSGIFEQEDASQVIHLDDEVNRFSPQSQKKFMTAFENCVKRGDILDVQVDLVTKNKKRYWLHYYAKKRSDLSQPLIVGTVRDITHQKLAEERFQTLFDNLQVPALLFGEGQIKAINQAGQLFFGVGEGLDYDKLHPAILFPLYQLDGRSSLERLKTSLSDTKEGKTVQQDWLFQVNNGREVAGSVSLFNIPFPEVDLHLMIIHDDSKRFEFERKLVDMSRKALHARRSKLEYITKVGILLDDLVDMVNEEISHHKQVELGQGDKLQTIKKQLEYLWGENINQGLKEGSQSILTDMNGFLKGLEKRWNRIALNGGSEVTVEIREGLDQYLWVDSIKLKLALNNLVNSALTFKDETKVHIRIDTKFTSTRHGILSFLVMTDAEGWVQTDWTILNHVENKPVKGFDTLHSQEALDYTTRNHKSSDFIGLVELLQGEVFFDHNDGMSGIGFYCAAERVIGVSPEELAKLQKESLQNEGKVTASDIWSHFGGDWDIIENTTRDFLEYYPVAIADLYYYLQEKDGEELERVATELYGVITHFPFFTAIERIVRIQKYSRYLRFEKVEFELKALSSELSLFQRSLEEFVPEGKNKPTAA